MLTPMSLSRSPSPNPAAGWTSRNRSDGTTTPSGSYTGVNGGNSPGDDQWAAAKARSAQIRGYPSITTKNEGFFQRSKRKISALPVFSPYTPLSANWKDPEKLGRNRWSPGGNGFFSKSKTFLGNVLRRFRFFFIIVSVITLTTLLMSQLNLRGRYRGNSHLGGGSKFVIVLGANEGGGVMNWKGPREWAIERDSIKNKKNYARRWGYTLEIGDMSTKKRYAHEWRESWEKVDLMRNAMIKYPKAEWFWWLDLNTFIMEPSISLQQHIFNDLGNTVYRDINHYNPLNITHPPQTEFLDLVVRSPTGDNLTTSIDIIIPQDCSGFNLGSFFLRRSVYTDRLLDMWWDPVLYEQKHMEWEHKEQDALEHLYTSQPYIRTHFAFIEQRKINAFPPGACAVQPKDGQPVYEGKPLLDERFHYHETHRDFMVNMAGCEWGRDCWQEMYSYRELSNRLNRGKRDRLKDWAKQKWDSFFSEHPEEAKGKKEKQKQ